MGMLSENLHEDKDASDTNVFTRDHLHIPGDCIVIKNGQKKFYVTTIFIKNVDSLPVTGSHGRLYIALISCCPTVSVEISQV